MYTLFIYLFLQLNYGKNWIKSQIIIIKLQLQFTYLVN